MARPSLHTPEIEEHILDRLASEDVSLVEILADEGMPAYRTVMRWLRENDEFRLSYARAREDQADYEADQVRMIKRQVLSGEIEPNAGRVAIDSCKWTSGVHKPKTYGTAVNLKHSDPDGGPVKIDDTAAAARLASLLDQVAKRRDGAE